MLDRQNIISELKNANFSFQNLIDMNESQYMVLSEYSIYFLEGLNSNNLAKNEIDKFFDILNNMGNSEDLEVQNLLVVCVLEILSDSNELYPLIQQKLKGKALKLFNQFTLK